MTSIKSLMFEEPQGAVEQVSVVFLDRSKLFHNETSKNVFEEFHDCMLHISQLTSIKAILMVCGPISMAELLMLHELAQLKTIFWKISNDDKCEYLQTKFVKVMSLIDILTIELLQSERTKVINRR